MKQIFINGSATTLFFNSDVTFDDVFEWIQDQVMFSNSNIFNLNEQHSCSVNNSINGDMLISGDKDSVTVTIEKIKPIL